MAASDLSPAPWATAALVLGDGSVFWGYGLGVKGLAVGEICFNTAMTGYQEILTDPSYAGQIITFTFPISAMSAPTRRISNPPCPPRAAWCCAPT
jgi:carbamoylphosphate synthase small subunit